MKLKHWILALSLCTAGSSLAADGSTAESGVWVKREHTLQFMGFTSTYSCDGLADKLKVLVKRAGARADIKASPGACAGGFGRPDKFARATVTFYALVPTAQAKPEEASGTKVQGTWQTVEVMTRKPMELQPGDCELVEQFRDQILPLFAQRLVDNSVTCVPNQQSGSSFLLRFEVFKPAGTEAPKS